MPWPEDLSAIICIGHTVWHAAGQPHGASKQAGKPCCSGACAPAIAVIADAIPIVVGVAAASTHGTTAAPTASAAASAIACAVAIRAISAACATAADFSAARLVRAAAAAFCSTADTPALCEVFVTRWHPAGAPPCTCCNPCGRPAEMPYCHKGLKTAPNLLPRPSCPRTLPAARLHRQSADSPAVIMIEPGPHSGHI